MTLQKRILGLTGLLLGSLILVVAALLWGLLGLKQSLDVTFEEHEELAVLDEALLRISAARGLLETGNMKGDSIAIELGLAVELLDELIDWQEEHQQTGFTPHKDGDHHAREAKQAINIQQQLRTVLAATATPIVADPPAQIAILTKAMADADGFRRFLEADVSHTREAAAKRVREVMIFSGLVLLMVVIFQIIVSILLYRSVVLPLRRLQEGVTVIAGRKFTHRLPVEGDLELSRLAQEFNRMAGELDNYYHALSSQVEEKTRELVSSERLAGVGYLAAGVAHEINNPLGIISGYAELTLKRLKPGEQDGSLAEALRIIRDEAFRCRGITEKLLSLAMAGGTERTPVDVRLVVGSVVSLLRGLPQFRDRQIVSPEPETDGQLRVLANDAQLKQVFLNLLVNALEASPPRTGRVQIEARRSGSWIEITVTDNGRGMTDRTLDHIFQPFYSEKPEGSPRGTGLGLSISHSIITEHGGRLSAWSQGLGHGSRFTVELPVYEQGQNHGKLAG